jgi:GntR family transcriptional regulator
MAEPAYVAIAGEYARQIRGGVLAPGTQLPSYSEIAERHGVSDIVVRRAIELLQNQGLIRSVRRRGNFVADRPNLVRVSPERQMEDPEDSFGNESGEVVQVDRETEETPAPEDLAEIFDVVAGDPIAHVVTRASEGNRPISISDTYQPVDVSGVSSAASLEETLADRLPVEAHGKWLRTPPGDLVRTVHQKFITADGRVIMVSDVSFPKDRYDSFVFRMTLTPAAEDDTEQA